MEYVMYLIIANWCGQPPKTSAKEIQACRERMMDCIDAKKKQFKDCLRDEKLK
jgi:hypothetical protein